MKWIAIYILVSLFLGCGITNFRQYVNLANNTEPRRAADEIFEGRMSTHSIIYQKILKQQQVCLRSIYTAVVKTQVHKLSRKSIQIKSTNESSIYLPLIIDQSEESIQSK